MSSKPSFRTFEASVLYFNGMYKLPIAPMPSLEAERVWQSVRSGSELNSRQAIRRRMKDFFDTILQEELNEWEAVDQKVYDGASELDTLVDLADLLGDIQVYCASEMARLGLPNTEILRIIMESNFSKLGDDGQPIYDGNGKVCKGPHYWKPEPTIKALLMSMRGEDDGS